MSVVRSVFSGKTTSVIGSIFVGSGLMTALIQNDFVILFSALIFIVMGFLLILLKSQESADPIRIHIINRTGRQLRIAFNGPGEIGKKNSGTVCGAAPFPPGKVSSLPGDVVSVEVSNRGSRVGSMDSAAESRMAGQWLDDA